MIGNLLTLLQVAAGFTFLALMCESFFQRRAPLPVRVERRPVRDLDAETR